ARDAIAAGSSPAMTTALGNTEKALLVHSARGEARCTSGPDRKYRAPSAGRKTRAAKTGGDQMGPPRGGGGVVVGRCPVAVVSRRRVAVVRRCRWRAVIRRGVVRRRIVSNGGRDVAWRRSVIRRIGYGSRERERRRDDGRRGSDDGGGKAVHRPAVAIAAVKPMPAGE